MTDPTGLAENDVMRVVLERRQQVRERFAALLTTEARDPAALDELRVLVLVHETCEELVLPALGGCAPDPGRLLPRLTSLDPSSSTFERDLREVAESVVGRYDHPEQQRRLERGVATLDEDTRHELGARLLACRGLFDQFEGSPALGTVAERARQVLRSLGD